MPRSAPTAASSIKQYVENVDTAPKLAERIWQAVYDLTQGFIYAYQAALEEALPQAGNPRWKPLLPLLFARLVHYLRHRRQAARVPLRALDPGQVDGAAPASTCARAELGVDRVPVALGAAGPNATQWTVEQEYLYVLLIHQLNTGNLSPAELDWATRAAARLEPAAAARAMPRSLEGFFVDIAGKTGLVRRTGNDRGSMLRYLDTTPLAEQLERAIAALRQAEITDQGPARVDQPAARRDPRKDAPGGRAQPQRRPAPRPAHRRARSPATRAHRARRASASDLGAQGRATTPATIRRRHRADRGLRGRRRARARKRACRDEHDSLAASLSSFTDPMWQVKDRSVAGLRIAASGGIGQSLDAGRAGRRAPVRRRPTGCSASCAG